MSILNTFLNQGKQTTRPINEIEKEVIVSKRFTDDKGKILKWKIRAMGNDAYEALIEKHKTSKIIDGELVEIHDRKNWQSDLVVESVVDPDLKDVKLCNMYGTMDPLELIRKMLLPGEFLHLVREIMEINGFREDYSALDDGEYQAAKK